MKILQISTSFKPSWETGGTVRAVYDISKALYNLGHEITVYTTDRGQKRLKVKKNCPVIVDNIIVYYFRNISNFLSMKFNIITPYYSLFVIRKNIKEYDIVHIHEHRTFLAVLIYYYCNKFDIPYFVQAHGSVLPFFQKSYVKKIFDKLWGNNILKYSSGLIALNDMEVEQYVQMGIPKSKITFIPNGINLSEYQNLPEKGIFRKKYGIKKNEMLILYLGRLNRIKGIPLLINAFVEILNEICNAKLVIAGPNDGITEELKDMTNSLGVSDRVIFTGPIYGNGKLEVYIDADVYVLPSIYEIFGITLLESLACGTPVIVTDQCGVSGLIKEKNVGIVVKYDKDQLKQAIIKILTNTNLQIKLGENGKYLIKNDFDMDEISKKTEGIYKHTIKLNNRIKN